MSTELTFSLTQPAKSKGGDKYVCDTNPDFTIYVPQTISRKSKEPIQKLKIIIQEL